MKKRLVLLGASGSIGRQTIDVVLAHPRQFEIVALSVGHQISVLEEILTQLAVSTVCVAEKSDAQRLQKQYPQIRFFAGDKGLEKLAALRSYDVLVNALVGFVGFRPTLCAIRHHHDIALANKETLVVGGELITAAVRKYKVKLYPIDSEHSAIWQCLRGNEKKSVKRLIITASGGAFRKLPRSRLKTVTAAQALAHPTWTMGAKITIDSATMMNKGFEVMEAHYLFDIPYDSIDVLMHDESVIHSMVEYQDHSVIAQLGAPDMRLPIQYALSYPHRLPLAQEHPLDLAAIGTLHFHKADTRRYPLLGLAYQVGRKGGTLPAVMNAANEVANLAFRQGVISFTAVEDIIIAAVLNAECVPVRTPEDLEKADAWGRAYATLLVEGEKHRK
jgi:1-deoxy-D-xylulose-5-phosphate reductoisomerase